MNAPGPLTWFNRIEATVELVQHRIGKVAAFSERNPNSANNNQDASGYFPIGENSLVLAVADGMGGANCGDQAAQAIISCLKKHLTPIDAEHLLRSAVLDAIEEANRQIIDWGVGAGATLALAIVTEATARVLHVGDAEGLITSNRGRIKFSSVSHAPVAMALEIGVIDEWTAMQHDERNLVSNYVGSKEMRIEIGPIIELGIYDTLLLATDGLFDNLMTQEIVNLIKHGPLYRNGERLLEQVRQRMHGRSSVNLAKPDDLTVLLFRRGKPLPTAN